MWHKCDMSRSKDGIQHNIRLTKYMHSPGMKYNPYSIPYAIKHGAKVRIMDGSYLGLYVKCTLFLPHGVSLD